MGYIKVTLNDTCIFSQLNLQHLTSVIFTMNEVFKRKLVLKDQYSNSSIVYTNKGLQLLSQRKHNPDMHSSNESQIGHFNMFSWPNKDCQIITSLSYQ